MVCLKERYWVPYYSLYAQMNCLLWKQELTLQLLPTSQLYFMKGTHGNN